MDHPVSNLIEADGFVIASATDLGRKRTGNEDSHALWVDDDPATRARCGMLFVVCDGMGGANAGEVASQLSVATVVERVRQSTAADPAETLREAVEAANSTVHAQAAANADQRGMGTTCTAVLVRGSEVWVGHVGDSRAYLVRSGTARSLTRDHSLVAELVAKGHLTSEEAKTDHRRNVVTRSVGALEDVQVDAELAFDGTEAGDVLVICSDGLHGLVSDAEIASLAGEFPPSEACASLIDLANERGGPDNITAIVVRRDGVAGAGASTAPAAMLGSRPGSAAAAKSETSPKSPPNLGVLGIVAGVMLVLVVIVGAVLFGQLKQSRVLEAAAAPSAGSESAPHPDALPNPATPAEPATQDASSAGDAGAVPAPEETTVPPTAVVVTPSGTAATPPAVRPTTAAATPAVPVPKPAATGRPGTVRLMTRPFQPSTFLVDGEIYAQDVGFLTQSLPPGDHVVRVEGSAGGAVDVPVHVELGGSYSLVAELPFEGGLGNIEIVITGASKAQVLVDGAQYPEPAPCIVRGLAPGPHSIRVMRPKSALPVGPAEVQVTAGGTARAEYRFSTNR